jgi:hypothetical protein
MVWQPFSPVNGKHASKLPLMGKSMQSKVLTGTPPNSHKGERMAKYQSAKLRVCSLISRQTPQMRRFSPEANLDSIAHLAPQMRSKQCLFGLSGVILNRNRPPDERRKWARLPLAIPVFVRSRDKSGKELLEFATALNVSATGALVAVRRALPLSSQVLLEIPAVPLASTAVLPKSCRNLRARTVWITHAATYQLVGLRFSQPLLGPKSPRASIRRKVVSSV